MNVFLALWSLWSWLRRLFTKTPAPYRAVVAEDVPEQFRTRNVYLIGENGHFWCAAMLCPCGCGEVIQLNLVNGSRPRWRFELDPRTQAISLRPSIWRTVGCRSHFVLRRGRVQWVMGTSFVTGLNR